MGCAASSNVKVEPADPASAKSQTVDEMLEEQHRLEQNHHKILLLGAGESGKSTVVKQIKMFYKGGIPEHEKTEFSINIRRNTIECMRALITATSTLGSGIHSSDSKALADRLADIDITTNYFPPDLADCVTKLWADADIKAAYARRNEFWLLDAAQYYFENVERVAEEDYVPTDEDMLMTRVRTTGIVVTEFKEGDLLYSIVDVGGQRNERRKWIHCFDDVKAIIFLCGLCEYNQVMFEDVNTNRMHESLNLYAEVCGNPLFKDTPIFLFLNKKDVFEEMIKVTSLSTCFPDFDAKESNALAATEFIQEQFRARHAECTPEKPFYAQVLSARVRMDMKIAFGEVKETLKAIHSPKKKKRR